MLLVFLALLSGRIFAEEVANSTDGPPSSTPVPSPKGSNPLARGTGPYAQLPDQRPAASQAFPYPYTAVAGGGVLSRYRNVDGFRDPSIFQEQGPDVGFSPTGFYDLEHKVEDRLEKKITTAEVAMGFLAYIAVLSILQGGLFALTKTSPVVSVYSASRSRQERQVEVDPSTVPNNLTLVESSDETQEASSVSPSLDDAEPGNDKWLRISPTVHFPFLPGRARKKM